MRNGIENVSFVALSTRDVSMLLHYVYVYTRAIRTLIVVRFRAHK